MIEKIYLKWLLEPLWIETKEFSVKSTHYLLLIVAYGIA
jgi:hypothetical protein